MGPELILPLVLGIFALFVTVLSAWNWPGEKYLCDNCRFNNDEDCKKSERPKAFNCLAYRRQE